MIGVHWTWFGSSLARANADRRAPAHAVILEKGERAAGGVVGKRTVCKKIVPPGSQGNAFWGQPECAACLKGIEKLRAADTTPFPLDAIFGKKT